MNLKTFSRLSLLLVSFALMAMEPSEIVQRADEVRNPSEAFLLEVEVSDQTGYAQSFLVAINGADKTRIETLSPAKDRGRNMLMLKENMWVFLPSIGRETRVGLSQKLMGEAANGDLSRLRWSGDYVATLTSENDQEWELVLEANKKGLTYDKMRLWVEKGSFHPLRAHYLTKADKILKRVSYEDYKTLAGAVRPSSIVIEDALRQEQRSVIRIVNMRICAFDLSLFHKSELGRMLLETL